MQDQLHGKSVIVRRAQIAAEYKIAQAVKDRPAVIQFGALDHMRMRPHDAVGACIDDRMGDPGLQVIVVLLIFSSEVAAVQDKIAAGIPQFPDLPGRQAVVLLPYRFPDPAETDADPILFKDPGIGISAVADPRIR